MDETKSEMTDHEQSADNALVRPLALSHVGIHVSDLSRSIDFYSRVFGFRAFYDNQEGPEKDRVVIGLIANIAVELIKKAKPTATEPDGASVGQTPPSTYVALTFSVPDVDIAYGELLAAGLANMGPPTAMPPDIRMVFLRDPDGTLLELIDLGGPKSLAEMVGLA
ncbi:VOC family protein [Nitrospirillum viridazoti]|nr:VOC family protein [Nitrospirillum amazonense]TWB31054.1 catechol 2,3-dioxygenase-like lactoylglutathione lyase family enzyme [Nitrospirillum amazonense]